MSYVIDGHNLIGSGLLPGIRLGQPDDEHRLVDRLRAFRAHAGGRHMVVFFDPGDLPASSGSVVGTGLEVRYARPGLTADEAILAFLRSQREPGQFALVTNDLRLALLAREVGASTLSANQFAEKLAAPPRMGRGRERPAEPPTPGPHDPAFADIYRDFLAREQTEVDPESAVAPEVWMERLYGGDPQLAQRAARWLGHHHAPGVLDALRDAVTHADAGVRAAAVLAMGDLGRREAQTDLAHLLLHDGASMVREAAAQSLARFGDAAVLPSLQQAGDIDAKSKVRKAAREAIEQIRARR